MATDNVPLYDTAETISAMQHVITANNVLLHTLDQQMTDISQSDMGLSDQLDATAKDVRGYLAWARQISLAGCPDDFVEDFNILLAQDETWGDAIANHPDITLEIIKAVGGTVAVIMGSSTTPEPGTDNTQNQQIVDIGSEAMKSAANDFTSWKTEISTATNNIAIAGARLRVVTNRDSVTPNLQ